MTQAEWELRRAETKAAYDAGLTRAGDRNFNIDRLKRSPSHVPPVMYSDGFQDYFIWLLSGLKAGGTLVDQPLSRSDTGLSYDAPIKLFEVVPYLKHLLGDELEHVYGFTALVDDYQYLSDLLVMGAGKLHPVPVNIERASTWLQEQILLLKRVNYPTEIIATAHPSTPANTLSPWAPLLIGKLNLNGFYEYLEACGLFTFDGQLTQLGKADSRFKARKAPWVGAIQALMNAGLLDANAAAICRALIDPTGKVGVKLSANTLRNPAKKAGIYLDVANDILSQRGLLRT